MKKLLLSVLMFLLLSSSLKSQVRIVFFNDVPPIHKKIILNRLLYAIPLFFTDKVTEVRVDRLPTNNYCEIYDTYNAFSFLDKLYCDTIKTVGITYKDINFECTDENLFGVSQNNAAITSIYQSGTYDRLTKTVLHELGHLYGLDHCQSESCIMQEGGQWNVLDIMDKSGGFCDSCKAGIKRYRAQEQAEKARAHENRNKEKDPFPWIFPVLLFCKKLE